MCFFVFCFVFYASQPVLGARDSWGAASGNQIRRSGSSERISVPNPSGSLHCSPTEAKAWKLSRFRSTYRRQTIHTIKISLLCIPLIVFPVQHDANGTSMTPAFTCSKQKQQTKLWSQFSWGKELAALPVANQEKLLLQKHCWSER